MAHGARIANNGGGAVSSAINACGEENAEK